MRNEAVLICLGEITARKTTTVKSRLAFRLGLRLTFMIFGNFGLARKARLLAQQLVVGPLRFTTVRGGVGERDEEREGEMREREREKR